MRSRIDRRLIGMAALSLAASSALWWSGPIPQITAYHRFADGRPLLGIPNFMDALSNLPFLFVGGAGLLALRRGVPPGGLPALRSAYLLFFAASALLFPGSCYYHLWPDNATLAWDRLPMSIAFMAFFAIVIDEHIAPALGQRLLWPFAVFGIASVIYWRCTNDGDGGDLRWYVLVQYLPMLLIPFIAFAYRSAVQPAIWLWMVLGCYGVAKVLELRDVPIFELLGGVSGHTLKHLASAAGIGVFLLALHRRHTRAGLQSASRGLRHVTQ